MPRNFPRAITQAIFKRRLWNSHHEKVVAISNAKRRRRLFETEQATKHELNDHDRHRRLRAELVADLWSLPTDPRKLDDGNLLMAHRLAREAGTARSKYAILKAVENR
jgi:hypothetical protein